MEDELGMDEGWAFYVWAIENDGWLQFSGQKRSSPAYIAQHIEKLMNEYEKANNGGR